MTVRREGNRITVSAENAGIHTEFISTAKPDHGKVYLADDGSYYNEGGDGLQACEYNMQSQASESYSIMGVRMSKSQKGIHIIRTRDGKVYKVLVK